VALSSIPVSHFDGHRNLTQAQEAEGGPTLAAFLREVKTLLDAGTLAPTLTPGAEVADVIPVAVAGLAAARQYLAEALDDTTMEVSTAAFTIAETGDGAEVSPTARGRLVFTTSAAGAAELSVTDVAGASGKTVYLVVRPLHDSADDLSLAAPAVVAITFD